MTTEMKTDHAGLMWAEVDDIGDLLHELEVSDWDQESLCAGWRVRDVIGHMAFGHTTPMLPIVANIARYKGNMTKGSFELSTRFGSEHTPTELLAIWDRDLVAGHMRKGISRTIKYHEGYLDHFIHNQDIRRPLDRPRAIPEERLVAALDLLGQIKTPLFATKPKVAGLRLEATDVEWSAGDGPNVRGPAEALVLAVAGRAIALDELDGDGVAVLADR